MLIHAHTQSAVNLLSACFAHWQVCTAFGAIGFLFFAPITVPTTLFFIWRWQPAGSSDSPQEVTEPRVGVPVSAGTTAPAPAVAPEAFYKFWDGVCDSEYEFGRRPSRVPSQHSVSTADEAAKEQQLHQYQYQQQEQQRRRQRQGEQRAAGYAPSAASAPSTQTLKPRHATCAASVASVASVVSVASAEPQPEQQLSRLFAQIERQQQRSAAPAAVVGAPVARGAPLDDDGRGSDGSRFDSRGECLSYLDPAGSGEIITLPPHIGGGKAGGAYPPEDASGLRPPPAAAPPLAVPLAVPLASSYADERSIAADAALLAAATRALAACKAAEIRGECFSGPRSRSSAASSA